MSRLAPSWEFLEVAFTGTGFRLYRTSQRVQVKLRVPVCGTPFYVSVRVNPSLPAHPRGYIWDDERALFFAFRHRGEEAHLAAREVLRAHAVHVQDSEAEMFWPSVIARFFANTALSSLVEFEAAVQNVARMLDPAQPRRRR